MHPGAERGYFDIGVSEEGLQGPSLGIYSIQYVCMYVCMYFFYYLFVWENRKSLFNKKAA